MLWVFEDLVGQAALHDMPVLHDNRPARKLFDDAMQLGFEPALRAESKAQSQLGFSHDYHEGVNAFQQKRAPQFRDK